MKIVVGSNHCEGDEWVHVPLESLLDCLQGKESWPDQIKQHSTF